jgi:hypothetical protein
MIMMIEKIMLQDPITSLLDITIIRGRIFVFSMVKVTALLRKTWPILSRARLYTPLLRKNTSVYAWVYYLPLVVFLLRNWTISKKKFSLYVYLVDNVLCVFTDFNFGLLFRLC